MFVYSAYTVRYIYAVSDRIGFSSILLRISVDCVQKWPATVAVALLAVVVQVLWVCVWALSALSIYHALTRAATSAGTPRTFHQQDPAALNLILFALLISFFWSHVPLHTLCIASSVLTSRSLCRLLRNAC